MYLLNHKISTGCGLPRNTEFSCSFFAFASYEQIAGMRIYNTFSEILTDDNVLIKI